MTQEEMNDIINDTSPTGEYIKFYEMLLEASSIYCDIDIAGMRDTLKFHHDSNAMDIRIGSWDKLRVIYEYSKLD